jgi:hypothetical protein
LTNGFSPLLSPKTKKQQRRPTQNTITMMAAFRGCGRRRQPTPDPATAGYDTLDPSGQEKWHSMAILRWRPGLPGRFFIDCS